MPPDAELNTAAALATNQEMVPGGAVANQGRGVTLQAQGGTVIAQVPGVFQVSVITRAAGGSNRTFIGHSVRRELP